MIKGFFGGFKDGFREFGLKINNIFNFIILFIVYFLSVALVSIAAKIFRKHFLETGKENKKTYWVECRKTENKLEEGYRQF